MCYLYKYVKKKPATNDERNLNGDLTISIEHHILAKHLRHKNRIMVVPCAHDVLKLAEVQQHKRQIPHAHPEHTGISLKPFDDGCPTNQ